MPRAFAQRGARSPRRSPHARRRAPSDDRSRREARPADRVRLGRRPDRKADALRERLGELQPATSLWLKAARELLDGQFAQVAATFDEIASVPDEAEARLRAGQALVAEGRHAEADEQFERALAFYRAVGATRYARRCEQAFAGTA